MAGASRCTELAVEFERLADIVEQRVAEPELLEGLRRIERLCASAADETSPERERRSLLANLKTAVETWGRVWPRLGQDAQFRSAVVREAGLWARRLQTMGKST